MISDVMPHPTQQERLGREGARKREQDLLARALALYWPDVGLALHRACEARALASLVLEEPIVDLGCGDGLFAALWTRAMPAPRRVLGCELVPGRAREANGAGGLAATLAADGCWIPIRSGCVGTVLANSVLTHVPEIARILGEAARVLRPGGQFVATVPGPSFERQLAAVRIWQAVGRSALARRAGDRYHLRWRQLHRDAETVWARRLAAHGLALERVVVYPNARAAFVWSLAFNVIRLGVGRFNLLNLLRRVRPRSRAGRGNGQLLASWLTPLLAESDTDHGSLFLVARKTRVTFRAPKAVESDKPRVYAPAGAKPDREAALRWLAESPILVRDEAAVMSGGYGNLIEKKNGRSPILYCEISGYAAQFWLRQELEGSAARAAAAGRCLLRVQEPGEAGHIGGAFPFGLTRPTGEAIPAYFSFDAAVCASALCDLVSRTGEEQFARGARLAGEFVLRMQRPDGSFCATRYTQPDHPGLPAQEAWFADGCPLHGKNAIALLKLARLTGDGRYCDAARLTLNWLCHAQGLGGEFPAHAGSATTMSHTHCYATEGLLYAGFALEDERYLAAGVRGAEWLRVAQSANGALHRDYRAGHLGPARPLHGSPFHVGPVAQAIRIWWVAAQASPGRPWDQAAERGLRFLARLQAAPSVGLVGGAFPQSARRLGPWLRVRQVYSPWEAMFAVEAERLWTSGFDDPLWSLF